MNKIHILIVTLLIIQSYCQQELLQCHPSCNCSSGSVTCDSCVDQLNSKMHSSKRFCECNENYIQESSESSFKCTYAFQQNTVKQINTCEDDILDYALRVYVESDCKGIQINNQNYIKDKISFYYQESKLTPQCIANNYNQQILIQINDQNGYQPLDSSYIKSNQFNKIELQFPLFDLYQIAYTNKPYQNSIYQVLNLKILMGNKRKFIRHHLIQIHVYTERNQILLFNFDVTKQVTNQCNPDQECVVVADLQINNQVCTDSTCLSERTENKYSVGNHFYAKIWLKDVSYKQYLKINKVIFITANDPPRILDFTSLTKVVGSNTLQSNIKDGSIIIDVELVEPAVKSQIQVNLEIVPILNSRRALQSQSENKKPQINYDLSIFTPLKNAQTVQAQNDETNNCIIIAFNLISLIFMMLI